VFRSRLSILTPSTLLIRSFTTQRIPQSLWWLIYVLVKRGIVVRLTAKVEDSSLFQNSHTGPLAHATPYSFENLVSSTSLKGPEYEPGHSEERVFLRTAPYQLWDVPSLPLNKNRADRSFLSCIYNIGEQDSGGT